MKLPFIAYGARDGYSWLNGAEIPLTLREELRRAAGKLPDFDMGETGSAGVVNSGAKVVIYRFMLERAADSRGRNAAYLALAWTERSSATEINADELLRHPIFSFPSKQPPDSIEYTGGSAATPPKTGLPPLLSANQPGSSVFDPSGSLAAATAVFNEDFSGTLRISRREADQPAPSVFDFHPPPATMVAPAPLRDTSATPVSTPEASDLRVPPPSRPQNPTWLVLVAIILALINGIILGYRWARWTS